MNNEGYSEFEYRFRMYYNNKQLLDEVEHDIMNYQNRGLCYLPKPNAEADNTHNTDTRQVYYCIHKAFTFTFLWSIRR